MSTAKSDIEKLRAAVMNSSDGQRTLNRLDDRLEAAMAFMGATFEALTEPVSDKEKLAAITKAHDFAAEAINGMDARD